MRRGSARNARLMQEALAYADGLHNLAFRLCQHTSQVEDLVQETYARASAAAGQFVSGTNLKVWLYRILRNTFIDLYRRDQRAQTRGGLDTIDETRGPIDTPGEPLQERAVAEHELERAIMSLNEESRMAILLDLEGFSEADIAGCLGCPTGTVKSRLFRARAALRERLRNHGE